MMNKCIMMGRLTRDPELRKTSADVSVCSFTLAIERDYKKGGEKETDFIDFEIWRQGADFVAKHFTKGRMALVEGRLEIRNWTDKEQNKRRSAVVVAERVRFADSKPKAESESDLPFTGGYSASEMNAMGMPSGFMPDFGNDDGDLPY